MKKTHTNISSIFLCIIMIISYFILDKSIIQLLKVGFLLLSIEAVWLLIKKNNYVYVIQINDNGKKYYYAEKKNKQTLTENLQEAKTYLNKKYAIQKGNELGELMQKETFLLTVKEKR